MSTSTEGIFEGLALWLVPSASSSLTHFVQEEMAKLREKNAGECSGEFGVHATLLAGLGDRKIEKEALEKVTKKAIAEWRETDDEAKKAKQGDGLTVGLKDVATRGSYFQCILIALAKHPSLLSLNAITRRYIDSSFPAPPQPSSSSSSSPSAPSYFPHISLLYASLTSSQAQTQIDHLHSNGVFTYLPHHHPQPNTDVDKDHQTRISFRGLQDVHFTQVQLWNCTGRPQDWQKVSSIPL